MKLIETHKFYDIYLIDTQINDTIYLARHKKTTDYYFVYPRKVSVYHKEPQLKKPESKDWYGFVKTSEEVKTKYNNELRQIEREKKLKRILE